MQLLPTTTTRPTLEKTNPIPTDKTKSWERERERERGANNFIYLFILNHLGQYCSTSRMVRSQMLKFFGIRGTSDGFFLLVYYKYLILSLLFATSRYLYPLRLMCRSRWSSWPADCIFWGFDNLCMPRWFGHSSQLVENLAKRQSTLHLMLRGKLVGGKWHNLFDWLMWPLCIGFGIQHYP